MPGREVGAWERERNERGATVECRFTAVDVPRSWRAYTQQDQSGEVLSQRYLHVGSVPGQQGAEAQLRYFCFLEPIRPYRYQSTNTRELRFNARLTEEASELKRYSVIGAIIASRLPGHPIGWICCAIGVIAAVDHFGGEYSVYALLARPEALPGGWAMLWLQEWLWMLFIGLIVFLLLLFPTGRLPSSRWRPFAWLSVAVILVAVILTAFSPLPSSAGEIRDYFEAPPSPIQLSVLLLGLVAAASVVVGRRNARGVERQQIKWLLYAATIFLFGSVLRIAVFYFELVEGPLGLVAGYLLMLVGGLGGPIAIGVAILRYRLYDIDIVINRTLVYGSLTAMLALIYFGSITATQALFRAFTGQEEQSQLAVVVSTLVIAALFTPLRSRIQGFIDRRFYRSKYDAASTLQAFSAKLRNETDLDALSDDLVGVVRDTMQPAHVSLWLRPDTTLKKGEQKD